VQGWLTANPTKRPAYVVLFPDVPSQVDTRDLTSVCQWDGDGGTQVASVQYKLHAECAPGWRPFVTSINMGDTNACRAYIDKLESTGANYSPGRLILSASAGGYAGTNYVVDDAVGIAGSSDSVTNANTGIMEHGVLPSAIVYAARGQSRITQATNVAGYIGWGVWSGFPPTYAQDGLIKFHGQSGWYLIQTIESFNGQRCEPAQGTFLKWYSASGFGGTNYSNTPVGAVTHVLEPLLPHVSSSRTNFGLWAAKKNFAICAWNSRMTPYFQAVGDPLSRR
jgi:hypothetical protein